MTLAILNFSTRYLTDGSNNDTADVIPANKSAQKKATAITCPNTPHPAKIRGKEINTSPGPAVLFAPAANRNEKIITPAISATDVSTIATNTDDAEGEVVATCAKRPTNAEIIKKLEDFIGETMQVPPKFSAVKINGERAYNLARAGEEVKISARPLFVSELTLIDRPSVNTAVLKMTCGKGGYVRAVARDLGEALGCYAHVTKLRRMWSGPFELEHSVTLESIEPFAKTLDIDKYLRPLEDGLADLPKGTTNMEGATKLQNGNPAICFTDAEFGDEIWVSYEGKALAIGQFRSGEIHPNRVILQ